MFGLEHSNILQNVRMLFCVTGGMRRKSDKDCFAKLAGSCEKLARHSEERPRFVTAALRS